jgi:hypothetical protein
MNPYINLKCWEIMNCDNWNCPARSEPETPCWEIAKRIGDYRDISNTCLDCVVYLIQKKTSVLNKKELQKILRQRGLFEKTGTVNPVCTLKTVTR